MLTQAPKGTKDVLPQDSYKWQKIESQIRKTCDLAGYREIRTPVFEHTELFLRSVGDSTDVVQKEMYTFNDKGNRSITLKPEGTAGTVRAFIEGKLYADLLPSKLFYINCPVFRYENPQSGRLREHHQFGVEVFGAGRASIDAEVINLAMTVISSLGITGLKLMINSIGCPECRATYHKALQEFLSPKLDKLCKTCNDRFTKNPLRILDCKEKGCKEEIQGVPSVIDCLCDDCATHFEELKSNLIALDLPFEVDPRIVRGLDYYTKTVFEIITELPTGQLTVCGGGRYDGLVESIGGPKLPGIGFGMGTERLLMVMDQLGIQFDAPKLFDAYIITLGDEARLAGMKLAKQLRNSGIKADLDHNGKSMKAQFKYADKIGAPFVLIIAGDELAKGVIKIRDMSNATESEISMDKIIPELTSLIGGIL